MLNRDTCSRLREAFQTVDYSVDAVVELIGEQAHQALGRNFTVPAVRRLARRDDPLAVLALLWPLQRQVPLDRLERALPGLVRPLADARLLEVDGSIVGATVDIRPYASDDGAGGWVVSDLSPGLDASVRPIRPDFVLGVSPASSTLAQLAVREPITQALDLGTGCGVQSLHLARHAETVVATELNPRAVELAALTFAINGVDVDLRLGSMYEPVADDRFDLIVTNPPYVMSPPGPAAQRLTYREGDWQADGLVRHVVVTGADRLADGGTLQVLANWAHLRGQDWRARVASWIAPTGCDALVVQREILDPYQYAELWLADAGLAGSPVFAERYSSWLDYFEHLQIEAVGMGWITLHRNGRDQPDLQLEDWPYAVEQPIGPAVLRQREAVALERGLTDEELLAGRWRVADDVVEESTATPGSADPQHIVLRQQRGFRRAVEVDTALAGVVGACDGDLTLARLVDTVAQILSKEPDKLRSELAPRVRQLLRDGFLAAADVGTLQAQETTPHPNAAGTGASI